MGGDESKPQEKEHITSNANIQDANHFFTEQLNKVSFRNRRQVSYYWIDPKIYNAENQKYFNQFLSHFKIDSFTSLEALKSQLDEIQNNELIKVITAASLPDDDYRHMQNQNKISQLFLFCGNEQRAKLLCKNFPKIQGYALKSPKMIELLKQFQRNDNLDVDPCSLLCMIEEDRKLLNKYRLNYFCITIPHNRESSKQDFVALAKRLLPEEQNKIEQFQHQYDITLSGKQQQKQALNWAFEDSFYWTIIDKLPKATIDPKRLAYLRLPFTDLYEAIFEMKVQKAPEQLYIVAKLSPDQMSKVNEDETLSNFIIFTSFVKGYTRKSDAIKQFKENANSFLFEVTFTQRKRQEKLDFGYVISDDKNIKKNVIFNIYNFFQLEAFTPQKRTGTLIYGPLSQAYYNRADQTSKRRLTQNQATLIRNYDYVQQLIRNDNSQAVILQMSGYFKESLQVYDKKVQYLKQSNAKETQLAKYIILRGDAYRMTQDYEQAEKEYKSIECEQYRMVSVVHLMQLYIRKGDDKSAQQMQQQLENSYNMKKLKQKFPQEAFKAQNYIALQWMKQGRYKEALKKYRNLQTETTMYYQYRFEGIPVVHDIFRNMATCQSKLNNHKEALNLLNSTKDWQLVCQGQSAGLALTETMIQCVYEELGNKESAREASEAIQHIAQHVNLQEKRYLNQSIIGVSMGMRPPANVNTSAVNVNLLQPNVNTSSVNVNMNQPTNVNQSSVNVNLNQPTQPVNVNESSVNVNLNPPNRPVNVNESSVNVDLGPQAKNQNWVANSKKVDIQNSNVNIKL